MGETKVIKVRPSTVIFIILIVLLIAVCGALYYFGFVEKDKEIKTLEAEKKQVEAEKTQVEIQNEELEKQIANAKKEENDKKTNTSVLTKEETQKILGPEDAYFCIEDIEKSGEDYVITAYILEKEPRILSDEEIENLKQGKEIQFRNQKWKLEGDYTTSNIVIKNKEGNVLGVSPETKKVLNVAGAAAELSDYSKQRISFNVSKDILIGNMFAEFIINNNGEIVLKYPETEDDKFLLTFDDLLRQSKGCQGCYEECIAYVKDGIVYAIQIFEK